MLYSCVSARLYYDLCSVLFTSFRLHSIGTALLVCGGVRDPNGLLRMDFLKGSPPLYLAGVSGYSLRARHQDPMKLLPGANNTL